MESTEVVKDQVEQTRKVLVTSLARLLARGEALSSLDERSQRLSETALEFHRRTIIARRSMWWRHGKLLLAFFSLLALLFVFVYILLSR